MNTPKPRKANPYNFVTVSSLGSRRRGKHHELVGEIMRQLKLLRGGMALEIPLAGVGGVELANLRSAVHRAAEAANISVETQSDEQNFYLWVSERSEIEQAS